MHQKGQEPNATTHNALINGCAEGQCKQQLFARRATDVDFKWGVSRVYVSCCVHLERAGRATSVCLFLFVACCLHAQRAALNTRCLSRKSLHTVRQFSPLNSWAESPRASCLFPVARQSVIARIKFKLNPWGAESDQGVAQPTVCAEHESLQFLALLTGSHDVMQAVRTQCVQFF